MEALRLVWDESFTRYDFGPGHPMSPVRLELTARLVRDLGLLDHAGVHVVGAEPAADDVLATVHTPAYIAAVHAASGSPAVVDEARGLGTDDVPVFAAMHEAGARIAAGTRAAALAVWGGEALHGVNFAGGLHHAMPARASGFCVYNDVAVAVQALLAAGARRVAYVDVDVHHGDGVERIFWDDPRVLTISLHETGRILFPGTGYATDIGGPSAEGGAVNVAFPPGTADAAWLRGFHAVVPPLVRSFEPDVLVTQHGCDSHVLDPLAHMALSLDCQRASYEALHELAHTAAGGHWVAVGGGGYEVVDVVPRAWAHLVGIAAHHPVDPEAAVPEGWREYVLERFGRAAPQRMTDGHDTWYRSWASGHDPEDAADRAVMATRKAVFPLHGLDPWYD
ncbi:MAG: acetoin utilization protein AcuC [Kineosporiaceae bacterium]